MDSFVLDVVQRDFSGIIEGVKLTASSRINSHTDLNKIDETRGNITVKRVNLLVNERNIDRKKHTHHVPILRISVGYNNTSSKNRHSKSTSSSFSSFEGSPFLLCLSHPTSLLLRPQKCKLFFRMVPTFLLNTFTFTIALAKVIYYNSVYKKSTNVLEAQCFRLLRLC